MRFRNAWILVTNESYNPFLTTLSRTSWIDYWLRVWQLLEVPASFMSMTLMLLMIYWCGTANRMIRSTDIISILWKSTHICFGILWPKLLTAYKQIVVLNETNITPALNSTIQWQRDQFQNHIAPREATSQKNLIHPHI